MHSMSRAFAIAIFIRDGKACLLRNFRRLCCPRVYFQQSRNISQQKLNVSTLDTTAPLITKITISGELFMNCTCTTAGCRLVPRVQ